MSRCAHRLVLHATRTRDVPACSRLQAAVIQRGRHASNRRASAGQDQLSEHASSAQKGANQLHAQTEKPAYDVYTAAQTHWNRLPSWYPSETIELHRLLQQMKVEDMDRFAPLPGISQRLAWTVFSHSSCYDLKEQSDEALFETAYPERSYEAYAEHGSAVLDFTLTRTVADMLPNLGRIAISHIRQRLADEDILARLADLYRMRDRVLCDQEHLIHLQQARSYEAGSDAFKAYIWAVFKECGIPAVEIWLGQLFTPLIHALYQDFGGRFEFTTQTPEAQFQDMRHYRNPTVLPISHVVAEPHPKIASNVGHYEDYLAISGTHIYEGLLPGWTTELEQGIPLLHEQLRTLDSATLIKIAPCPPLSEISQWTVFQHRSCYNVRPWNSEHMLEVLWPAQWYNIYAMHGDGLMNYLVGRMLAVMFPNMTRMGILLMRARLVANNVFARLAVLYGFVQRSHVYAAKPIAIQYCQTVEHAGDVFEAYVWAVYKEHGMSVCAEWLVKLFPPLAGTLYKDHGGMHAYVHKSPQEQRTELKPFKRFSVEPAIQGYGKISTKWVPMPGRVNSFKKRAIHAAQQSRRS